MRKQYYPSINSLRGIAALMVCFFHFSTFSIADFNFSDSESILFSVGSRGKLGVYVFFAITGFVIPLSLLKYKFHISQFHKYLAKRWVRIEIPYLVSIACILLIGFIFSLKNGTAFSISIESLIHHLFYTVGFSKYEWYNPIYWTLAIEIQFYIIIALMYPLMRSKRMLLNCILPIIFCTSALFLRDSRLVFYYAPIFAQGIFLFFILQLKLKKIAGIIGILFCASITFYLHGFEIFLTTLVTLLLIVLIVDENRIFSFFGDISYSLYLIHGIVGGNVIYFLREYSNSIFEKIMVFLLAFIISILAAYLFWKFIENPSKKWSKKIEIK